LKSGDVLKEFQMRTRLIAISVGVVFLFGCSHTSSAVPQPKIVQSLQSHSNLSPDSLPSQYSGLHSFVAGSDGKFPQASVVRDASGNLYGTTIDGGGSTNCEFGCGVVFKIDVSGHETVLHSFSGTDGEYLTAGLIVDDAGNLFGTAQTGGSSNDGLVFKLDPSGNETVLHNFTGGTDGAGPHAALLRDASGNLYGSTGVGGSSGCGGHGCGVVFKIDSNGNESVFHSFSGTDGSGPSGALIQDAAGNFYGATQEGGSSSGCRGLGCGVVFKLDPSGNETVLHSFSGADGAYPGGPLIRDSAGNLYGTTIGGGSSNDGIVFKIKTNGHESVLLNFSGLDGWYVNGGLVMNAAGVLFGTTFHGGSRDHGVVFALDTNGNETVLHSFGGGTGPGKEPFAGLFRDAAGNLYGTTQQGGGNCGCGVVFELSH
jgi:uncharacterized repeat protein (TIGR03803 family)